MTKLIITRGLPGAGKTTWAQAWVAEDPKHRADVNRDMLRLMMHGGFADAENVINMARDAIILTLLRKGIDVVSSDTNLPQRTVRSLAQLARKARCDVEIKDMTDVGLHECFKRNSARTDKAPVPEDVISNMYAKFIRNNSYPLPLPYDDVPVPDMYVGVPSAPNAILVDIDGTVALRGSRNPYDESRVAEDTPNRPVINLVQALYIAGFEPIFISGRSDKCYTDTKAWLDRHIDIPFYGPFMRREGDYRADEVVKRELFEKYIRAHFNIRGVLDDRDRVVRMWREELGLTCFQVAEGDF